MTEFSDLNLRPINNKQAIIVDGSESKDDFLKPNAERDQEHQRNSQRE